MPFPVSSWENILSISYFSSMIFITSDIFLSNIKSGIPIFLRDNKSHWRESSINCRWNSEKSGAQIILGSKEYIAITGKFLLSPIFNASVRGVWSLIRRSLLYQTMMIFSFFDIDQNNILQSQSYLSIFSVSKKVYYRQCKPSILGIVNDLELS